MKAKRNHSPDRSMREYLMAATLFVQQSAEYDALCLQAYAAASQRLHEALGQDPGKPAIVLDLDETVLDNSAYSAWQVTNDQPYSPESWAKWTALADAPAVPGVRKFLAEADTLGVQIFYISNRDTAALEDTMRNMRELGLPQVESDHFYLKTNTSDKSERRAAVEQRGYDILLFIGDNLGDFHERWDKAAPADRSEMTIQFREKFGRQYIVLPNPIYGSWEGALYDFNWSWSDAQRDSIRRRWLDPAPISAAL